MAAPAYHLRTNKAVERLLFLKILRKIIPVGEMADYTYYSFGGPYLDDFRLIHENFPDMKMVSIERDPDIFKRQQFHQPNRNIELLNNDLHSFLAQYDAGDKKCVFWLDYTQLEYYQFEEFMLLLSKVSPGSIIKITLMAQSSNYQNHPNDEHFSNDGSAIDKNQKFRNKFQEVLPSSNVVIPRPQLEFAKLLQSMLRIASQKALPSSAGGLFYQPLTSFYYKDGNVGIFTLTGIVCEKAEVSKITESFSKWKLANLHWKKRPTRIDIPVLSTKERLQLQSYLPCAGRDLLKLLGYKIDGTRSLEQMKQYAEFYTEYPYFIRAVI
ncbi:MAG: hypothetical protein NPIRA06_25230 [Nitrospirales bacterium]|nr:MAG: hypothetical protein NPIRA06_25230 [Nitrospirales bacterium]